LPSVLNDPARKLCRHARTVPFHNIGVGTQTSILISLPNQQSKVLPVNLLSRATCAASTFGPSCVAIQRDDPACIPLAYRGSVDSAVPHSARAEHLVASSANDDRALDAGTEREPESYFTRISGLTIAEFCRKADADAVGLKPAELAGILLTIGDKYRYGLPPEVQATQGQICSFWRSLQLGELALAHACALGREVAWQQFLARYSEPLTRAAIGIAGSGSVGQELADSLYSELFGLANRDGQRRSPLASYAGRGSLLGFLRTTLAQRYVDHIRRTHRETPLDGKEFAAPTAVPAPLPKTLSDLGNSLTVTLQSLEAEERFILSAWFLDQRTLHEIAQVLRVHEATVSRQLKRLTGRLHKELLKNLQATGMSRRAAEEALGTDPRDLTINLRSLLQYSPPAPFLEQGELPDPEKA
jgi:RNA polymerase sigma-70 factor, ECF subfamily